MRAQVGNRVVVDGHHVGDARRSGEIYEILPGREGDRFRVRWDNGGETILYPESDCMIFAPDSGRAMTAIAQNRRNAIEARNHGQFEPAPAATMDLWFDEDDTHTEARATIRLRDFELTGFGRARRRPHEPNLPAVGEELAAARALSDLAHQLLDLSSYQLEKREGHPIRMDL
jgi:hypothetical protein